MNNIIMCSMNHLKLKSFHFPDCWVEACLEWLFNEHKNEIDNMTIDKWCDLIEQQWLFTDLRDLDTPCTVTEIPDDFYQFDSVSCFQIMSCRNVSKSYYSQVREIKGTVNENSLVSAENSNYSNNNNQISTNRTLMLSLTDGVNEFDAFEYEPWDHIGDQSIQIGYKCRLKGPFVIRNRIAFLKQKNIEIIGGEVEILSKITSLSIVEEQLRLNTNKRNNISKTSKKEKKPPKITLNSQSINNTKNCNNESLKNRLLKTEKIDYPISSTDNTHNHGEFLSDTLKPKEEPMENVQQNPINLIDTSKNVDEDDELFMSLAMDDILPDENATQIDNYLPGTVDLQEQEDLFEFDSFDSFGCINDDYNDNGDNINNNSSSNNNTNNHGNSNTNNCNNNISNNNELSIDKSEPFMYLIDIFNELSQPSTDDISVKQFKIKGLILTFSSKLKIIPGPNGLYRWDLQIVLSDGTATVDCQLDDSFITEKIGFTAQQFQEMKKTDSIGSCKRAFVEFQAYVAKCNCGIFTLQVKEDCDKMCVVGYSPVNESMVEALRKRISQYSKS